MAGRQGFEPWIGFPMLVFKTSAFNRSAICPYIIAYQLYKFVLVFWKGLFLNIPFHMVVPTGLEPVTNRLWAGCSNQLSYRTRFRNYFHLVAPMRVELMTFRVWTGRSNHLSYRAMVEDIGVEPTTSCVQGRRSSQMS